MHDDVLLGGLPLNLPPQLQEKLLPVLPRLLEPPCLQLRDPGLPNQTKG